MPYFLEMREGLPQFLQSTKQVLNFVAPLVHLAVVLPRVGPRSQRRHHRIIPQCQFQLPSLVALVRAIPDQRGTALLMRKPLQQRTPSRKRPMDWRPFFGTPSRQHGPSRWCCPSSPLELDTHDVFSLQMFEQLIQHPVFDQRFMRVQMVCQFPILAGNPRHLQPCSATHRMA